MENNYFLYQDARIHYLRFGEGKKLLIALHGFGDRGQLFQTLVSSLKKNYTVCALDLPFHGDTHWPKTEFTKNELIDILQGIRQKEGQEEFDLMGYSFGGRLIISILPDLLHHLNQLYLIAPDGIRTKWLFNINLLPRAVIKFWIFLLQQPKWFLKLLNIAYRSGLITRFIYDFTRVHISTPERRERLFGSWLATTHFNPEPKHVKKLLIDHQINTHLYFGTRDEVIPLSAGKWMSNAAENIQLHIIEEGHLLVDEKLNRLLHIQLEKTHTSQ